jgi:hypothetical protein
LKDLIDYVPLVSDVEVTISYLARRHRFLRVDETATLYDVVKILRTRNHRVPVNINPNTESSLLCVYLIEQFQEELLLRVSSDFL